MRGVVALSFVVGTVAFVRATPKGHNLVMSKPDPRTLAGWPLYERLCLPCHGALGDGSGPAAPFTWGRPRAFVAGEYEWRSTAVGQPPTDDDLRTTIRFGAPGSSMPGFADTLGASDIDQLIAILKAFAPSAFSTAGTAVSIGAPLPPAPARGAQLWTQLGCNACHGDHGKGDGAAAKSLREPPYDLTRDPLRRPRATDDPDARRRAAATSIATGMAGSPMPGYAGQVSAADLWALADHVIALGARAERRDRSALDEDEIARDHAVKIATGTWPGSDPAEMQIFGAPLAPQGTPPPSLAPAEASMSSRQCARCHAKQASEWQTSIHGAAGSPGLFAQLDGNVGDTTCRRCHTPLAEQQTDRELATEGVTCASCHVRDWERRGPPNLSPSLATIPGYPLTVMPIYERADFCLPCHQLPPRTALVGKPLLNTYKEWLDGPYMRRGIQCQSCHMPNREHRWLGIHDRDTFRQGIRLTTTADRVGAAIKIVAELDNIGAGHYLPTTPTPAAWLRIELVDTRGAVVAHDEQRIGRDIWFDGTWHERADTRIPPGDKLVMARAWSAGRTADATIARITVEVHPDDYYEGFYAEKLRGTLAPAIRTQYQRALARARSTHYVAEQRDVALSSK